VAHFFPLHLFALLQAAGVGHPLHVLKAFFLGGLPFFDPYVPFPDGIIFSPLCFLCPAPHAYSSLFSN
jgi:hypothetical protein